MRHASSPSTVIPPQHLMSFGNIFWRCLQRSFHNTVTYQRTGLCEVFGSSIKTKARRKVSSGSFEFSSMNQRMYIFLVRIFFEPRTQRGMRRSQSKLATRSMDMPTPTYGDITLGNELPLRQVKVSSKMCGRMLWVKDTIKNFKYMNSRYNTAVLAGRLRMGSDSRILIQPRSLLQKFFPLSVRLPLQRGEVTMRSAI
jgi:hypothetical protein